MNDDAPLLGAVIGSPVSHSLSPVIHEAAFAAAHRQGRYVAVECPADDVGRTVAELRERGVVGISVTMPLKEVVIEHLDSLSDDAHVLRAVNCISFRDGRAVGHNTDGDGCCDALARIAASPILGETAVVLGAGGAGRSVALALLRRGADVVVVNRTLARATELVSSLGPHVESSRGTIRVGGADDVTAASILVNTTSVGMNSDETPLPVSLLHPGLTVLDAVYTPMQTALLRAARSVGAAVVDGLWMLIDQACRQQVLWFGGVPDREAMRTAAERELASRQK